MIKTNTTIIIDDTQALQLKDKAIRNMPDNTELLETSIDAIPIDEIDGLFNGQLYK